MSESEEMVDLEVRGRARVPRTVADVLLVSGRDDVTDVYSINHTVRIGSWTYQVTTALSWKEEEPG